MVKLSFGARSKSLDPVLVWHYLLETKGCDSVFSIVNLTQPDFPPFPALSFASYRFEHLVAFAHFTGRWFHIFFLLSILWVPWKLLFSVLSAALTSQAHLVVPLQTPASSLCFLFSIDDIWLHYVLNLVKLIYIHLGTVLLLVSVSYCLAQNRCLGVKMHTDLVAKGSSQ